MAKDFEYDKDEMKMRELAFEVAKFQASVNAWLSIAEWEVMKKKYDFKDEDFPSLAANVKSMYEMIKPGSSAHELLFNNPFTKLAVISQPTEKKEEENEYKNPDDGNFD